MVAIALVSSLRPTIKLVHKLTSKVYKESITAIQRMKTREATDLTLVKKWIGNCKNHRQCREPNKTWHPKRLLMLANKGKSAKLWITSTATSEIAATDCKGPYITLSHRWGKAKYTKLKSSNIEQLQNGIVVSELPMVFQDAFIIAERLGIHLVWIDSLCIIQEGDDGVDWEEQCQAMHSIYANAFLNISATGSSDDLGRLLKPSQCHIGKPCKLSVRDWLGRTIYLVDMACWDEEIVEAPLNQRAWVFQERYLAPRVIHVGEHQLGWECRKLNALEAFPKGLPIRTGMNLVSRQVLIMTSKTPISRHDLSTDDQFHSLWRTLVTEYSRCDLTCSKDKLPALAGLVNHFKHGRDKEYAAGMWEESLICDLAWYTERAEEETSFWVEKARIASLRAPSWSWASVDGEIKFPDTAWGKLRGKHISSLEFTQPSQATNTISSGTETRLIGAKANLLPITCLWENQRVVSFQIDNQFDFEVYDGLSATSIHIEVPVQRFQNSLLQGTISFLPLLTTKTYIHGLILTKVSGREITYYRLGSLKIPLMAQMEIRHSSEAGTTPEMLPGDWVEPKRAEGVGSWRILWNRTAFYMFHHIEGLGSQRGDIEIL